MIRFRTKKFHTVVGALALGALLCLTASTSFAKGAQDFTLHNETEKTVKELYVSPHSEDEWGEDVLGDDTLDTGDQVDISFDRDEKAESWDMKIVFSDGKSSVWTKLKFTEFTDLTISYKAGKPWATWKNGDA